MEKEEAYCATARYIRSPPQVTRDAELTPDILGWVSVLFSFGGGVRGMFRPCRIPKLNRRCLLAGYCGSPKRYFFGRMVPVAPAGRSATLGGGSPAWWGCTFPRQAPPPPLPAQNCMAVVAADGGVAWGRYDSGFGDPPGRAGWGMGVLDPLEWGQWRGAMET